MTLAELRKQIDETDGQLIPLLAKRFELSDAVAELKRKEGLPVLSKPREQEILDRILTLPAHGDEAASVYRHLFELSRNIQAVAIGKALDLDATRYEEKVRDGETVIAACPGAPGSNCSLAKCRLLPLAKTRYYATFAETVAALVQGDADYAVLPTHNSNAGSVLEVYDEMAQSDAYIVDSLRLSVRHDLLALPGASADKIASVYSHPQALAQCREYLKRALPHAELKEAENTALAARFVSEKQDPSLAAIAAPESAAEFGLSTLAENIQDNDFNETNFVVLARRPNLAAACDKISIIASLPHETGTLYRLLTKFYINGLNLFKIESRPIPNRDFEYLFYLDFNGNALERRVAALLAELKEELPYFKFLGNY